MWLNGDVNGDNADENQEYFELELSGSGHDITAILMSNMLCIWTAAAVRTFKYLT
jgi:hypothetical protein